MTYVLSSISVPLSSVILFMCPIASVSVRLASASTSADDCASYSSSA